MRFSTKYFLLLGFWSKNCKIFSDFNPPNFCSPSADFSKKKAAAVRKKGLGKGIAAAAASDGFSCPPP